MVMRQFISFIAIPDLSIEADRGVYFASEETHSVHSLNLTLPPSRVMKIMNCSSMGGGENAV